ncbi:MAG: ATP-binding cassette domain-containing protein [Actinomycetaceae bacterium]|nr:ATP-binding cassette domain-containing protein [Actinomycetaceae bacterium]
MNTANTLTVNDLHKSFGKVRALRGMSFTAQSGELFGFVGANGAGKTTTMRIILGVLQADSGTACLGGKEITFSQRQNFGYMPEERGLYPRMKVGEQITYLALLHGLDKKAADAAAHYWLERLGVAGRWNDQVQALSLGNQQRVQLAAALTHDPQVLVLDEPFSGLDPLAVTEMTRVLKEKAAGGATVIFSSHQLDLVERICDRVGICTAGKIVASGTVEELRSGEKAIYDIAVSDPAALTAALPEHGITEVTQLSDGILRVTLPAAITDQDLLHLSLEAGAVHSFAPHRQHLNELFANVVPENNPAPATAAQPNQKSSFFRRLRRK